MGNYLGYGLQAGVQGFQSGFNMAQKKTEMEWQKKQRKLLENKQAKMLEVTSLWNAKIKEIYADKIVTEEESAQLATIYLSGGYEFMEHYKGAMDSIKGMSESKFNQELEWMDLLFDWTGGQDPNDLSGVYDDFERQFVTTEKSKALFEARRKMTEKGYGIAQEEKTWERGRTVPSENRAEWFRQQGIDIPEAEPTTGTISYNEKRFNWKIDQLKAGKITTDQFLKSEGMYIAPEKMSALEKEVELIIKYGGTNEEIKDKLLSKGGGGTTTPTSFKTLEAIKESFENVKTKAEYNSAIQSYNASKEAKTSDWTPPSFEGQLTDLIKKVESAIWADYVNKDGKLKSKGDAEEYNTNLQHYLKLIEEARNAGVDVSQFQSFIPYKALYSGLGDPLVTAEGW